MRIAVLGATSYIAQDFIRTIALRNDVALDLYGRNPEVLLTWLSIENLPAIFKVKTYSQLNKDNSYDAIINFIGVGNPADAKAMGASIFAITAEYDKMALDYLHNHPKTKYIFLSSGIAYGSNFENPVDECSKTCLDLNNQLETDWYAKSKIYCELLHRSLRHLNIIDLRIFNYFSRNIDLTNRYLITDILRAVKNQEHFYTNAQNIWRDFLHPQDFYQIVSLILAEDSINDVFDCYSQAPIDKFSLLNAIKENFSFSFSYTESADFSINATGLKKKYYSENYKAAFWGYKPQKTSMQCIIDEATSLMYANTSPLKMIKNSDQNATAALVLADGI